GTAGGGHVQGDVAAQARAEEAEASVQSPMEREELHHGLEILDARGDGGVLLVAARLAAAAKVEARQGQASRGKLGAQQQVLVTVLRRAEPVTGDHARHAAPSLGHVKDESETGPGKGDGVLVFSAHVPLAGTSGPDQVEGAAGVGGEPE